MNTIAISAFACIVLITLIITYVASRRVHSKSDFYVAGGNISGTQNGLAIAGDFISAATLLGTSALIFNAGFDAGIYLGSGMIAFSILIFLMTDKLKKLGRYSLADVVCVRLDERPVRSTAAICSLCFAIMYLVVQVVGAGALIQLLFGLPYKLAVVMVSVLMVIYVSVGGMLATTWVQITKAIMLLVGITVLLVLALAQFHFDLERLFNAASSKHTLEILSGPGGLELSLYSSLSLGLGLTFGLAGAPHLIMRFFTVPDARAARKSAAVALGAIAYVNMAIFFIIGWAAIALVKGNPAYIDSDGAVIGGTNMVSVHLAHVVGGDLFLGVMSAVAFATILAVVAGLTLAAVSAVSHDLYANVIKQGKASDQSELTVSRVATVVLGIVMIILGIAFEGQNIAYLVSLALAVAASTNFPLLILSMYWRGLTTRGAVAGCVVGLLVTIVLVVIGPAVWVDVLGNSQPLFNESYPALYAIVAAFFVMWGGSVLDKSDRGEIDRLGFSKM
jgi:cation/acetate symporter